MTQQTGDTMLKYPPSVEGIFLVSIHETGNGPQTSSQSRAAKVLIDSPLILVGEGRAEE